MNNKQLHMRLRPVWPSPPQCHEALLSSSENALPLIWLPHLVVDPLGMPTTEHWIFLTILKIICEIPRYCGQSFSDCLKWKLQPIVFMFLDQDY